MHIPTVQKKHQLKGHNSGIYALVNGDEPGVFLSGAGDGWVVRWSIESPEEGRLIAKVDTQIFSLAYWPRTNRVVAGDMNGGVHWLNLNEDRPNKHIAHHSKGTYSFQIQGEYLFSVGGDGVLTRWSIEEQRTIDSLQLGHKALRTTDYDPNTGALMIGSSDCSMTMVNTKTMEVLQRIPSAHESSVFCVVQHPKKKNTCLSGGRDAHLKVWSLEEGPRLISDQPAHWFTINDIIFTPDGSYFLTASRDKTIRIWDATTYELCKTLDAVRDGGHVNSVNKLLWIKGTSYFVSASDDRTMILWEWRG